LINLKAPFQDPDLFLKIGYVISSGALFSIVLFVETLMSDPATANLIPDWLDDPYFPDF
jgi:hypothetical protein